MNDRNARPQTAVWYFVAATFIFAAPTLFFRDAGLPWLLPLAMGVGFAVFACGVGVLVHELRKGGVTGHHPIDDSSLTPADTSVASARTSLLSLAATATALLAVAGCVAAVVLELPLLAELAIILVSVVLLAGAGALIGIVITRGRTQTP